MSISADISPERIDHIERTAKAAFVLGMNALLHMRAKGVISEIEFTQCVENASAVSEPLPDTGLFRTLFGFLDKERGVFQMERRGIDPAHLDSATGGGYSL